MGRLLWSALFNGFSPQCLRALLVNPRRMASKARRRLIAGIGREPLTENQMMPLRLCAKLSFTSEKINDTN